jgi:hypothetical protein
MSNQPLTPVMAPAVRRRQDHLIPILAAMVVCFLVLGALGFAAFRVGSIEVKVRESGPDGVDLAFSIPATMVEAAIHMVPDEVLWEASAEIDEWLPMLEVLQDEIRQLPDCELVHVESDDERVRVAKRRGKLIVEVEDGDDEVRVAVPIRFMSTAMSKLASAAR